MTVDCYLKYKFKETHFVLFKEAASNTVFQKGKNNGQSKISDQIAKEVIGFIEDLQWNKNSYLEIFQLDLENREYKINIEIDGDQYHYDSRGRLFGRNAFRDQILNLMGWKVLRIKISFWKSMDIESRRIWLNNKLNPLIHSTQ
jgi:very-short-patch-repair endonuclease